MAGAQHRLKEALRRYVESGDNSEVQAVIDAHPALIRDDGGEYPDFHRILDLVIDGRSFRVCRWISNGERLSLVPTERAQPSVSGVPLWLSGQRLRDWAQEEEEEPSQDATDWEQYR